MDSDKERVVFVEFNSDGTPWEVITTKSGYDFALSKKFGLLYHGTGTAHSTIKVVQSVLSDENPIPRTYWASPDVTVEEIGQCIRLETLPETYTPEKLFDAIECVQQIVWCGACGDCMPDEPESLCEHVWYCECGEISTPGERCECSGKEEDAK